jgi:hypothetical protein
MSKTGCRKVPLNLLLHPHPLTPLQARTLTPSHPFLARTLTPTVSFSPSYHVSKRACVLQNSHALTTGDPIVFHDGIDVFAKCIRCPFV